MDADTKRRVTVFGTGVLLGLPLAIGLYQYAANERENRPRETTNVEVVLTSCALAPGDVFEEKCVERRVIAEHLVPPDVIVADNVASWTGKPIQVELTAGQAVRTVDFDKQAP